MQARPSEKQLGDTGGEGSGVMGTSFYISPEIRNAWASYDSKVPPIPHQATSANKQHRQYSHMDMSTAALATAIVAMTRRFKL